MLKEMLINQLRKLADLNKDGELNVSDLLMLVQLIISYLLTKKSEENK
jgi:hypothetical protein